MTRDIIGNLSTFELAILILLVFVAFYFIHLAVRDYRNARIIRMMSHKIRDLINGRYTDIIDEKADVELMELSDQLNDLSDVFRLTHENLAQEKIAWQVFWLICQMVYLLQTGLVKSS